LKPTRRVTVNPTTARQIGQPIALSELSDKTVLRGLALWEQLRAGRAFPTRAELVPKPIAPILRNVMLIALLENDLQFRIVGDAAVVAYAQNFQGMRRNELNTLQAGFGDVIMRVCNSVCSRRAPLAVKGIVARDQYEADHHEGVFLPLGNSTKTVDHILFVAGYSPLPPVHLANI